MPGELAAATLRGGATGNRTERKESSRRRILDSAGARIRTRGIGGTSVSDVMDGAGMTVGGFYAHFPSKDALVAEAVSRTLADSMEMLKAAAGNREGEEWLRTVARIYLSRGHRDNPSSGCPLPACAGEAANADRSVRDSLAGALEVLASEIATHEEEAGATEPRSEALAALALMVGGLTLSRSVAGTPLSDEFLSACRRRVERRTDGL